MNRYSFSERSGYSIASRNLNVCTRVVLRYVHWIPLSITHDHPLPAHSLKWSKLLTQDVPVVYRCWTTTSSTTVHLKIFVQHHMGERMPATSVEMNPTGSQSVNGYESNV